MKRYTYIAINLLMIILLSTPLSVSSQDRLNLTKTERDNPDAHIGKVEPISTNPIDQRGKDNDMIEFRSRTSKQYANNDGTYTSVISAGGSLHYYENGFWKNIENAIKPNSKYYSLGYDYANLENAVKSFYSSNLNNGIKSIFKEGEIVELKNLSLTFVDANKNILGKELASNTISKPHQNTIKYENVFNNTSLKISQHSDVRAIDFIIENSDFLNNIPSATYEIYFTETISIPQSWSVKTENRLNEKSKIEEIVSITLIDNSGKQIIRYSEPIYYEENKGITKDANTQRGAYSYVLNGTELKITKVVPMTWLKSQDREFPIVIDPTANFYPTNSSWKTGTVSRRDETGDFDHSTGEMQIGWEDIGFTYNDKKTHAWASYNLSSILSGSTIVSATTFINNRYGYFDPCVSSTGVSMFFVRYGDGTTNPSSRTASQKWDDITGGNLLASFPNAVNTLGWHEFNHSGTSLLSFIQSRFGNDCTFGYESLYQGDDCSWSDDSYFFIARGHDHSDRPYLTLTYCASMPVANAGTNIVGCTNSATLNGSIPAGGQTGTWSIVSGCIGCTFSPNANTYNATLQNIPAGTHTLKWTVQVTGDAICSSSSNVNVTNNTPSVANAGIDATTCTGSYQLGGNSPAIGSGVWTVVSGSAFFDPNNTTYNATVSNLDAGANVFRWTITNNGCTSQDDVTITSNSVPVATISTPASSPHSICNDNLAIVANNPGSNNGQWSIISGTGVFANGTAFSTTVSGLSQGNNIIRWTVTANGVGCTNQANRTIVNNTGTIANAGPDITTSSSTAIMQANTPTVGTGTWTCVGGCPSGIVITTPSSPTTSVTGFNSSTPSVQLRWCIQYVAGGCPASCDDAFVYYDPEQLGIVLSGYLNNSGSFIQTNDPNYFIMTASAYSGITDITGEDATYIDAKLRVAGNITFKGSIISGKFVDTWVQAGSSLTVDEMKTYKNHKLLNSGTMTLNSSSAINNSGDWTNANIINADATSTVVFNGDDLQTVITNTDGAHTTNLFGNVVINNSAVPNSNSGVKLATNDFVLKNTSSITFTDGALITNGRKIIVNNPAPTGIILGGSNSTGTESWVYATSDASALRKYMNDDSETYHFPVGAATHGNLATIKNNNLPNGTFYLDTWFKVNPTNVNAGFPDSIVENATRYAQVAPEGVWVFNPNGTMDGTYDLSLYYNQFATASWSDNYFSILSRPNDPGNGTTWQLPPTNSTFQALSLGSGFAYRTGLNSFSEKGVGVLINNLPVELLSFYAHCLDGYPLIKWSTATEINNSHFIIEKSYDAQNFFAIARMEGAGNSNSLLNYEYHDKLNDRPSYYRLKQFDFDGSVTIYDPIVVNCDQQEIWLKVYPNPFKEYIIVSSNRNAVLSLTLTDGSGKLIQRETTIFDGHYQIDLRDLSRGIYVLILQFENEEPKHFKLVKN